MKHCRLLTTIFFLFQRYIFDSCYKFVFPISSIRHCILKWLDFLINLPTTYYKITLSDFKPITCYCDKYRSTRKLGLSATFFQKHPKRIPLTVLRSFYFVLAEIRFVTLMDFTKLINLNFHNLINYLVTSSGWIL